MSPRTAKQFEAIREERLEQLKATALRLFSANGYHATSISSIAKEAGISKGLLYNYFESKEDLLTTLFEDYYSLVGSLLNPNNDDEITNEELEDFFDLLVLSFKEKHDYWMLFLQLSMQPDVLNLILARLKQGGSIVDHRHLLYNYFVQRFEDPQQEFLLFNSIIKGFSMLYVITPEIFSAEATATLLNRIKAMFIRDKLPGHMEPQTDQSAINK